MKIFNCVTGIESPSLAGGGSNFTITSTELNAIGWLDYIMGKNECIGIKVEFTANCPNSGGMFFQLPIIEFVPTSYCGLPVSSKANFLPVPITSSMCSNCFGITKTISPQPAIAGQQVTYTINVYGLNAAGPSIPITVDDIFPPPPNFTMSPQVIFPMTVNVPAFGNYPINVTGIFNNLNTSCPATNFTNTATLLPSGPSAEVCAIVTCPLPTPNDFHVTNTDYVASSVFSGVNPPTGSIIFVDDYVNLEIDMNMIFDNCTFIMGSGSSIDVLTGFTLIFNHNTVLYSCPQMWQGIIIRSGASIDVNNSIIKDADRGIYVEHDALFRVINSQILDCVSGIFTEDYGSANNTIGYVAGTTFKLDNLALKGSYNGQDPHGSIGRAGMVLNNIALMTVGDNGASENLFEKLNFGIEIHNSNIDVTNCRFETITPDNTYLNIGILKPLGCAITARQDQEGFYYLNSFPLANTASTTISNAIVGVYTNLFNARINSVTMDNVVRGIVSENSPQRIVVAMGCEINATYRGIDWYDNDGAILMFAQNNTITVLPIGPGLTKQSACISMTELSATAQANYEVSYNPNLTTISAGAGIWANTVNNALIEGNIINTTEDVLLPAPGSAGIALTGGSRCTVLCNTVNNTIPSTNLITSGIYTSQSSDNTFDCNNLYYSARGMFFSGFLCANTVMRGNKMDNNYIGLYLDNTAVISQQPVIPPPPDPMPPYHGNEWIPFTFGSGYGAVNMNAPPYGNPQGNFINRFTIRDPSSSGGVASHLPLVPTGTGTWPNNIGWFDPQNSGSTFECTPSPGVPVCGGSIAGGGDEKLEEGLRLSIVQDSVVSVEYIPESKSLAKQYVYAELSIDSTLLIGNSVYQNFKNVNNNTAIGKLFGVKNILKQKGLLNEPDKLTIHLADSLIQIYLSQIKSLDSLDFLDSTLNFSSQRASLVSNINIQYQGITSILNQSITIDSLIIQAASTLNNQITGGELPQINEKFVNTKTLQYYVSGASALTSDFSQLVQIAMQCPAAGGPSVYTARGLVKMLTDSIVYDDENVCLQSGYFRVTNNSQPKDKSDLEVIPNPASETVEIILKNAPDGICRVRFISTLGRHAFVKQFNCLDKSLSVDVSSFPPGIYYVETMMPESLYRITKLVIVR